MGINPHRIEWVIENQGTERVFLSHMKEVSDSGTKKGRELDAGEMESINKHSHPGLIRMPQYAVTASGSTNLWVWEA